MLTDVVIANRSYTRLDIAEHETVDEIALKVMKQDCPDFLLPIRIMEIDGEKEIRYEQQEGIRLCYSSMKMRRKDFLELLGNLLQPFRICDDWFLDYHNILLDANYVLLGRNDQGVKYIYVPVVEYARKDAEILDFFSNLILKAEIQDDSRLCIELLRVLKGDNSNLMTLLDFVTKENGVWLAEQSREMSVDRSLPQKPILPAKEALSQSVESPQTQTSKAAEGMAAADRKDTASAARPGQSTGEFGKQDVQGKLMGSLFDDENEGTAGKKPKKKSVRPAKEKPPAKEKAKSTRSGGLFDIFKGKAAEERKVPAGAQGVSESCPAPACPDYTEVVANMAEDVTEIFTEEHGENDGMLRLRLVDGAGYDCPKLVEIDLHQGFATVGRRDKNNQAQSDYSFDASLSFISRRHFRVEREGDHWVIIDLGSGNGTLINGKALIPNIRHPLFSGDTVMISAKRRLTYQVC